MRFVPNLTVLTVPPSQVRIETMQKTIVDLHGDAGSPYFLFNTVPVLGMDTAREQDCRTLLTKPWMRANTADFFLNATD